MRQFASLIKHEVMSKKSSRVVVFNFATTICGQDEDTHSRSRCLGYYYLLSQYKKRN